MSDVFYLRPLDPPVTGQQVAEMAAQAGGCFNLHQVDWKTSFLATAGDRMLCWYQAPDAEAARNALRQLGSDMHAVWPGTLLAAGEDHSSQELPNLLAEIQPENDQTPEALYADIRKLATDVKVLGGIYPTAGKQLICLLLADSDAQATRFLAGCGVQAAALWPCEVLEP